MSGLYYSLTNTSTGKSEEWKTADKEVKNLSLPVVTSSPLKYSCKINCPKGQLLSTSNDKLFKPVCDNKGNFGQKKYPRLHVQESSGPAENFKEKPALFSLVKLGRTRWAVYFQGEDHSYGLSDEKKLWM